MSSGIGRLSLSIVGVVVGSFFGVPGIGLAIGSGLGFLLFPPEGKTIEGPRLNDLKVSFSSYGQPIPLIFGTMETGGNVVWSPGLVEHRKEEVGGKGAPSTTVVSFLYTASFRINYSVGPAQAILKNWADGDLIRDRTGTGPVTNFFDTDGPGNQAVRDFLGTTTQLPGPAEQADKGIADTPAYRGTVGQEWEDMALEDFGNRIPQMTAEIAMVAADSFPSIFITVTNTVLSRTADWVDSPGGNLLIKDANTYSIIDNISQTQIITATDIRSFPELPCIDSTGNFYITDDGFGDPFNSRVQKYSTSSLQLIVTGTDWRDPTTDAIIFSSSEWRTGRVFGGLTLIDGTIVGEIIYFKEGVSSPTIVIINPTNITNSIGGVINTYDAPTAVNQGAAVVDNESHLWISGDSAGDTKIYRLEPGTGSIIETQTLTGETFNLMTYEPSIHALIFGSTSGKLVQWDIDTQTITARNDNAPIHGSSRNLSAFWIGPTNGKLYLQAASGGNMTEYDIINMTEGFVVDPGTHFGIAGNDIEYPIYDPIRHALITLKPSDRIYWLFLERVTDSNITVRSVVETISALVDYVAGTDIDATELTDTFPGYIVRSRITARKALEPLATAFNFRSVESDHIIKFPKRGGASVGNIPQIDLGATAGETPTTRPLEKTRISEDQLFETAIIEYIDPTFDNQPNTQQAKRIKEAIDVGGSIKFQFPGALGNDQAAQIIERILFQAWSGRTNISTSIPLKHILKDPGDVVTITKDGKTFQVELHDVKLGANSVIKIAGTIDDSVTHVSVAVGASALGVENQTIDITGPTEFFILDIPLLRDADNGAGIYISAGSSGTSWPGAAILRGLSITGLGAFTAVSSSRDMDFGFTSEVLADADSDVFDRDNTINLKLLSGTLSSDTETAILNGANALLIGDEIIQFVNATLNADGTHTLDTLLRGRRGTEFATGTHLSGDRVIILSTNTLMRTGVDLSDHLTTFFYKAITLGGVQLSSKTIEQNLKLRSQMPYAPSHVTGSISADDWNLILIRRTRVGGSWKDLVDAPLGENSESYEWDIMSGSVVKRTLTSITEAVIYTSAQQVTDFGSNQTTIEVNAYQISDDVGRGFVTNVTLVGG